jgi:hypothetical protein
VADVNDCAEQFSNYANIFFLFTGVSSSFSEEMEAENFTSLHPANPWSITHEPIHYHCASLRRAAGISDQGDTRRLGTRLVPDLLDCTEFLLRNDDNQTENSMRDGPKS